MYKLTPADWLRQGAIGAALCAAIAFTFYKSLKLFVLILPAGVIAYPLIMREKLKEKRQWELVLQFREAIWSMSGYMNAGLSPENALIQTIPDIEKLYGKNSMMYREFGRIASGIKMNIPMERFIADLALRSDSDDIRSFAEVFSIVKRSGGSMREVVEKTSNVIRDKITVMEEIKTMTASKRYEQNIMNVIPFAIILYMDASSAGFMDVMYGTFAGRITMTFCLILIAFAYFMSTKIMNIKI